MNDDNGRVLSASGRTNGQKWESYSKQEYDERVRDAMKTCIVLGFAFGVLVGVLVGLLIMHLI